MLEMVLRLKELYSKYLQDVSKVYKDAKPMDGLFGWGDDPRKDPCHMGFYKDVEQWVKTFQAGEHDQAAAFEAVRYILTFPADHREDHSFWFTYAAQGLARELIPLLTKEQCAQLRSFYDEVYPKRDRMPVQKEVYRLLKKGAGRG